MGSDFACDLVIYRGAGSYVCGEASALITSIEGKKGYPRNRPPRLTVRGLYQRPTVINNVESLANIEVIVRMGAEEFRKIGTAKSPARSWSRSPATSKKPGVYEVEYGTPLRKFIYEDCGGVLGRQGPEVHHSRRHLDQGADRRRHRYGHLDHKAMEAVGSQVGSGGMVVIAEGTCMVRLLQVLLRFYHHESCGQCTPCREGMGWMHRIIDRIVDGKGRPEDIDALVHISKANDGTTICGMGDAAGFATVGIIAKYRDEFEYYITHEVRRRARSRRASAGACPCLTSSSTGSRRGGKGPDRHAGGEGRGLLHSRFCWHPQLSVAGNCRICVSRSKARAQLGRDRLQHAGHRRHARADGLRGRARARRETLQFLLLNHPVDCGICDKAGECMLQDYHYEMNGLPSISTGPKVRATKYHELSSRIVLDNERCIVCSRCVRFTREISKSHALGIQNRGDGSLVRAAEGEPSTTIRIRTMSSTSARSGRC